jgi:hypothetical protein
VCREDRELLANVGGAAIGAVGLLAVSDELLEMRLALHADVLVDRHARSVRVTQTRFSEREARSDTSVTVRSSDGHTVTCSVPAGTNLSLLEVGTSVKMHCHKRDGRFRLAYFRSEHAVMELER